MKGTGLDNYYDLIIILGKTSVLVEQFYYQFDDSQLESIDSYYDTILFHVRNRSPRASILSELEGMIKYIEGELNEMGL